MRNALLVLALIGIAAAPAAAQGRGNGKNKVPPGQMPRAGECRVWYDGVPPGRQPAATDCDNAERVASRDPNARVLYGDDRRARVDRYGVNGDDRYGVNGQTAGRRRTNGQVTGRAVPRGEQYPVYGDPRNGSRSNSVAYRAGYQDGADKAREDVRDGDQYDPARHGWYKSANRGYDGRYGSREQYAAEYRDGFLAGYREVRTF